MILKVSIHKKGYVPINRDAKYVKQITDKTWKEN